MIRSAHRCIRSRRRSRWRARLYAASTILNELYPAERQLIDAALAHAGKGKVEAAYNRARHLERLRDLMQRWADLIMPE
jgi:hypothetical protein